MNPALDQIWISAAQTLGIPVQRGGDAYVHYDGQTLHICDDEHLDADDTVAQLVFHELCHALVQGPQNLRVPDWGLDNTSDRDAVNELAAVRLQAHFAGAWGLRKVLFPTTSIRTFFEELPRDAFHPVTEESSRLARIAAIWAAKVPWRPAMRDALEASVTLLKIPRHPKSGHPLATEGTCGDCIWRSEGGLCRQARTRAFVDTGDRACTRLESRPDCLECGACCRSAYDTVEVTQRDPVRRRHPDLVEDRGGILNMRREGDHCAALGGPAGGPFGCTIYEDRPKTCRDFENGGRHCIDARRRVGLSF